MIAPVKKRAKDQRVLIEYMEAAAFGLNYYQPHASGLRANVNSLPIAVIMSKLNDKGSLVIESLERIKGTNTNLIGLFSLGLFDWTAEGYAIMKDVLPLYKNYRFENVTADCDQLFKQYSKSLNR